MLTSHHPVPSSLVMGMMRASGCTAALLALGWSAAATAQAAPDGWSLSGSTRVRFEAIDGQARTGFNRADGLVNLRTTVLAQYRDGPVRIAAELWDSRVWGADAGTPISSSEVNTVEPVQAFVEVKTRPFDGEATLTAGRFLLNLGSRRVVAADDYRNTTNGYTGVRADLAWRSGWAATLIYTLPQQRRPDAPDRLRRGAIALDREGFDLVLWGGLVQRKRAIGPALLEMSYFHLGERDTPGRPTRDRSLDTFGLRAMIDPAPRTVDGEIEALVQRGQLSASAASGAATLPVRAWFVHADLGYTFADAWNTRLALDYDHASGDSPGGTYGRFDTIFGMRRADLAPSGLYNAIARSNVISPGVRIETAPGKRTDMTATARAFWLAAQEDAFASTGVRDASGRSGRFAGVQFDARLRHALRPWLRLELDAVLLDKGRFLRDAPNATRGAWTRYVSTNLMATF